MTLPFFLIGYANKIDLNLPQFDGHFEKEYTMKQRGVSNEKEADIFTGV